MSARTKRDSDSPSILRRQQEAQEEEFREAVRALLMTPLMSPEHDAFPAVRRHIDDLRDWFLREAGWMLEVDRGGARLFKRPADLGSVVRGLEGFDRRRYVVLCLVCAALERAEPQITLRILGDRLLALASEPALAASGFTLTLTAQHERRELVTVCKALVKLGVLALIAGDQEAFAQTTGDHADALYDIQRRLLAGLLAATRGPSSWPPNEVPVSLDARLRSLVEEHVPDSEEGRRTAVRHQLARRLLDDPVVYADTLDADTRAYFVNQRGTMASRLCEATGLVPEQRAEGLALVDETGALTDVAMPAEGTDAHVTLLVGDFLAQRMRKAPKAGTVDPPGAVRFGDIVEFLRKSKNDYARHWRQSARVAGSERELAETAIGRLEKLQLVVRRLDAGNGAWVFPLPALARFALGTPVMRGKSGKIANLTQSLDLP